VAIEQADYELFWPEGHGGNWRLNKFVIDLLQNYGTFYERRDQRLIC